MSRWAIGGIRQSYSTRRTSSRSELASDREAVASPSLPRGQDVPVAPEAEAGLGRRGQVVLAAGDVGAAVDDRHPDGAPVVAQRHPGAAGQALVGHAERARRQAAAAREMGAV